VLVIGIGRVSLADVTTERGSSILIYPKIVFDSQALITNRYDTLIQISNTSNSLVFAHCFYVNAAPLDPSQPPSVLNPPQWIEVDFDITLTKQQPTHWLLSDGRPQTVAPKACDRVNHDCNGAGFNPGPVPPVPDPFVGELKCLEVDSAGAPINGNHLKGEATIVNLPPARGDASKYNAVGILGLNTDTNSNNSDTTLCLGGDVTTTCPTGAEYNACPETVILNHFAENATEPVYDEFLGAGLSHVRTELTLVPCSEDFENQAPKPVTVQFRITNEFEELFSASTTVTCWGNFHLLDVGRVFDVSVLGSRFAQTRMSSPDEQPGFIGVVEEFHNLGHAPMVVDTTRAALNLHGEGERVNGDVILVPEGQ